MVTAPEAFLFAKNPIKTHTVRAFKRTGAECGMYHPIHSGRSATGWAVWLPTESATYTAMAAQHSPKLTSWV